MGARIAEREEQTKHSVAGTMLLWLLIVGSVAGGGGFYAYRQGWLLAAPHPVPPDSAAVAAHDSAGQTADTTAPPPSDGTGGGGGAAADTAHHVPPGTPGRLTLQGVPAGARVTLNGQPVKGTQVDLAPNVYKLAVRLPGYETFERQVVIAPGAARTVSVELAPAGAGGGGDASGGGGPCDQYGPAYNQDHLCYDTRPVPLSQTYIPVPADAPVIPRQVTLLCHVSRSGETIEARLFARSNVETFNDQALDVAKNLRWNPAQKNGEPVDAWVQWPFVPKPVTQ